MRKVHIHMMIDHVCIIPLLKIFQLIFRYQFYWW